LKMGYSAQRIGNECTLGYAKTIEGSQKAGPEQERERENS
jgi:hypothetical protein